MEVHVCGSDHIVSLTYTTKILMSMADAVSLSARDLFGLGEVGQRPLVPPQLPLRPLHVHLKVFARDQAITREKERKLHKKSTDQLINFALAQFVSISQ